MNNDENKLHFHLKDLFPLRGGWYRASGSNHVLEPERWWHKLGVKRNSFTYTMSMHVKP